MMENSSTGKSPTRNNEIADHMRSSGSYQLVKHPLMATGSNANIRNMSPSPKGVKEANMLKNASMAALESKKILAGSGIDQGSQFFNVRAS